MTERQKMESDHEAMTAFSRMCAEASATKRWMAAVWTATEVPNTVTLKGVTTWDFPTGSFDEAVKLLQSDCDEMGGGKPLSDEVLPLAQFVKEREQQRKLEAPGEGPQTIPLRGEEEPEQPDIDGGGEEEIIPTNKGWPDIEGGEPTEAFTVEQDPEAEDVEKTD